MKKMIKRFSSVFIFMVPIPVYAASEKRMDMVMLEAILIFLRFVSLPMLVIAIGLFILSIKEESGEKRIKAFKFCGTAFFLQILFFVAKASGLC